MNDIQTQNYWRKNFLRIVLIFTITWGIVSCQNSTDIDNSQNSSSTIASPENEIVLEVTEVDATENPVNSSVDSSENLEDQLNNNGANDISDPIVESSSNHFQRTDDFIDPDIPEVEFSLSTSNHTTPEDIMNEITYTGGAGGGGDIDCTPYIKPTLLGPEQETRVIAWIWSDSFDSCGWKPGELVQIFIESSDGSIILEQEKTAVKGGSIDDGLLSFSYAPDLFLKPDTYSLNFVGNSGTITEMLHLVDPNEPRVYRQNNRLILYNFSPNEEIRLLAYDGVDDSDYFGFPPFSLQGWQSFKTSSDGHLAVKINDNLSETHDFIVIGETPGEVHITEGYKMYHFVGILSPHKVAAVRPDRGEVKSFPNLWELAGYKDLNKPGEQKYYIEVESDEIWQWNFSWCAINSNTLESIRQPVYFSFFIDDRELNKASFLYYRETASDGWECLKWATLISNWPTGETIELEIKYELREAINDGVQTYSAGAYSQIMVVQVNP